MNDSRLALPLAVRSPMRTVPKLRSMVNAGRHLRQHVQGSSLRIPANREQVQIARRHTRIVLGEEHPCIDAALIVVSELVTNAIVHGSTEGAPVLLRVWPLPRSRVVVTVTDRGGGTGDVPRLQVDAKGHTSGRGLFIVGALAARWSIRQVGKGHRVRVLLSPDAKDGAGLILPDYAASPDCDDLFAHALDRW